MSILLRRIDVLDSKKPPPKLKELRVRSRRLLFLLAAIILGDTASLHAAFGPAPRCLPPAALQTMAEAADILLPISELGPAIPNYRPEERDYLIRTIVFEASGESEKGKAAVAFVILNRERSGRWGDDIKEVVTQPWQFEPWMTRRKEIEKLSSDDPRYQNAARIADVVLSGQMEDPTAGSTHFLNPVIVRQRRGGSLPSWARGEGQPIGRHTFYSPSEGGAGKQPALSKGVLANPLSCERTEDEPANLQLETDRIFDQMAIR
jgi:spore germination cell wall hydrolase CwlJ-like protein